MKVRKTTDDRCLSGAARDKSDAYNLARHVFGVMPRQIDVLRSLAGDRSVARVYKGGWEAT